MARLPEIEAAIFAHFRLLHECEEVEKTAKAQVEEPFSFLDKNMALAQAKKDRERTMTKLRDHEPVMGEVFASAERSLISLARIAGAIEGSMYRAIRELERLKAERQEPANDSSIIDVEADEE